MATGLVQITQTLQPSGIQIPHYALAAVLSQGIVIATSGWLDLGSPKLKFVDGFSFEINQDADFTNVYFTLEYIDRYKDRNSPRTTGRTKITNGDEFIPLGEIGRFFRVKLEDLGPEIQWQWSAIQFYGEIIESPEL